MLALSLPVPGWMPPSGEGHSRLILQRLGPQGNLVAFDQDPEAIQEAARITDARFPFGTRFSPSGRAACGQVPLAC